VLGGVGSELLPKDLVEFGFGRFRRGGSHRGEERCTRCHGLDLSDYWLRLRLRFGLWLWFWLCRNDGFRLWLWLGFCGNDWLGFGLGFDWGGRRKAELTKGLGELAEFADDIDEARVEVGSKLSQ
jgi:hypothetical protein